jgi:hypothetical protein
MAIWGHCSNINITPIVLSNLVTKMPSRRERVAKIGHCSSVAISITWDFAMGPTYLKATCIHCIVYLAMRGHCSNINITPIVLSNLVAKMTSRRERVAKIDHCSNVAISITWDCAMGPTYLKGTCIQCILYLANQNSYNYWSSHVVAILATTTNGSFVNSK